MHLHAGKQLAVRNPKINLRDTMVFCRPIWTLSTQTILSSTNLEIGKGEERRAEDVPIVRRMKAMAWHESLSVHLTTLLLDNSEVMDNYHSLSFWLVWHLNVTHSSLLPVFECNLRLQEGFWTRWSNPMKQVGLPTSSCQDK